MKKRKPKKGPGKRGPPKKPTILKLADGNPGKRKLNTHEPKPTPVSSVPAAPNWLCEAGRAEWDRIAPELLGLGLLTVVDVMQLAGYCTAYADLLAANEALAEEGTTITTDKGNTIQSPHVGMKNRALEIMRKFASDFGLSPASRASLDFKPASKDDELPVRRRG